MPPRARPLAAAPAPLLRGEAGQAPSRNQALREARQQLAADRAQHYDVQLELEAAMAQAVAEPDGAADCPICMEPPDEPVQLDCGHSFCRPCLFAHVSVYGRTQCPMCRAVVSLEQRASLIPELAVTGGSGRAVPTILQLQVGNMHVLNGDDSARNRHSWTCYVRPSWRRSDANLTTETPPFRAADLLDSVTFGLHPTFRPSSVSVSAPDPAGVFSVSRRGWGVFQIDITCRFKHGRGDLTYTHMLDFDRTDASQMHLIPISPAVLEAAVREQELIGRLHRPPRRRNAATPQALEPAQQAFARDRGRPRGETTTPWR